MIFECLSYDIDRLDRCVLIEPMLDYREYAIPKLISKEYSYRKIQKRVQPLEIDTLLYEYYYVEQRINLNDRVIVQYSEERRVYAYYTRQQLSTRHKGDDYMKSKKERERHLLNELKSNNTENNNIQILVDKNGKEIYIDSDDNDEDDDESNDYQISRKKVKFEGGKNVKNKKIIARVCICLT